MKLLDHPFNDLFYWKGKKYRKFIQLKDRSKCTTILCYEYPYGETIDMPAGRKVKPILRIEPC